MTRMNRKIRRDISVRTVSLSAVVLAATAGSLLAGPISPPAGPVTPTHKTLTETEPRTAINSTNTPGDSDSVFKITQPGSYYLTANVQAAPGKHGIEITSDGVRIDLNGFCVDGTLGGLIHALDGIHANNLLSGISIRNGSVRNWYADGIDLSGTSGCTVSDVLVENNGAHGITPGGSSRIYDGTFNKNVGHGINLSGSGNIVRDCIVSFNEMEGIHASGTYERVERCTVQGNASHGIMLNGASVVEDNICSGNGVGTGVDDGAGIRVTGSNARVVKNHLVANDFGISTPNDNNIMYQNFATANTQQQFDYTGTRAFGSIWSATSSANTLSDAEVFRNFYMLP